jgi:hypothetical protein
VRPPAQRYYSSVLHSSEQQIADREEMLDRGLMSLIAIPDDAPPVLSQERPPSD